MNYFGFNVYSVGNAQLEIINDELHVTNVTDSGFDGVLIDTKGLLDYTINFGDLSSIPDRNGVLKSSILSKNSLNQVVTFFESFEYCDEKGENVIIGFNNDYLPNEFNIFGTLNGAVVFNIPSSEIIPVKSNVKIDPVTVTLVLGLITIGISIWKELRSKEKVTVTTNYDGAGNLTGTTVTVTKDPVPFDVVVNNDTYTVDNVGINYDDNYPVDLIGNPSVDFLPIAEQITGYNLSEFVITSINTSDLK